MYFKYTKRRSTNHINIEHVEEISYYFVEDEKGNEIRELAIYFVSGRVYKERTKADEIYRDLRALLDLNTYSSPKSKNK